MSTLELVGWLRRFRMWSVARAIHHRLRQPVAELIHSVVMFLGKNLIPGNIWLKHQYDYTILYIDPQRIGRLVKVGDWRRTSLSESRLGKVRAWYRYGDGLKSVRTHVTRNLHGRFIANGDWDTKADTFEVLPVIPQLFGEGRQPQETDEYQRYLKRIDEGRLTWTRGCRNQSELDEYYDTLIQAYENIRTTGYRTQVDLGESGVDEIRVCIDRHGEICLYGGGTHRISIAKFLGLDVVPVTLRRVHLSWISSIAGSESRYDECIIRQGLEAIGFRSIVALDQNATDESAAN